MTTARFAEHVETWMPGEVWHQSDLTPRIRHHDFRRGTSDFVSVANDVFETAFQHLAQSIIDGLARSSSPTQTFADMAYRVPGVRAV